jgi:undecaprenyl diphosphate synthase
MEIPSTFKKSSAFHIAIIMDGNGRWALRQRKARYHGHRAGAESVRRVVEAAPDLGITTLTLYAFSSDNWGRPQREVAMLMRLFQNYLQSEVSKCVKNGVRISFIGRRDRLDPALVSTMETAEEISLACNTLHLRLAIDYSARDMITKAASQINSYEPVSREVFSQLLAEVQHDAGYTSAVDLLIRTGGEKRLSDFLLWECAYAELYFTDVMWPDFNGENLKEAIFAFKRRERRYGRIPDKVLVSGK